MSFMEATLVSYPPVSNARRTTRLATALFFFICVPLSVLDQFYVPRQVFVLRDPVATANNLLANEFIFRISILSHLAGVLVFFMMGLLFYRIFRPVDKHLARVMIIPLLAVIPVTFVFEVFNYTALMVLKGEIHSVMEVRQQQDVAYFLLRMLRYGSGGVGLGKLLFGLYLIPFGMLTIRSGFAPRIIGILAIIGGAGYLADCCLSVLMQRADYLAARWFVWISALGYMAALLWFLIKGTSDPKIK